MDLEFTLMTNPFKKILYFVLYFALFAGGGIWGYYHLKDSPFKREFNKFDLSHIGQNCPNSPTKQLFQECLRSHITQLAHKASPLEALSLPDLLNSYYNQDKIQGEEYEKAAHKAYIINQVIFYESLSSFAIRRDSIDFFQIIMLPIFRWKLGQDLEKTKEIVAKFINDLRVSDLSPIEKRYFNKFAKLKVQTP